jgi:hypothetical protein
MAKLTSGRLLIASRGASLYIQGDPEGLRKNRISVFDTGFEGTLVAFEMPKRGVGDYDMLIRRIQEIALERSIKTGTNHWIRFEDPPSGTLDFIIKLTSEDTVKAEKFAQDQLVPRILKHESLSLDFRHIRVCTQSYIHALLFNALQNAFEYHVPLYVTNATPSVADSIRFLEMYAL